MPGHQSNGKPLQANAPPTAGGGAEGCSFRRRMAGRRVALPPASARVGPRAAASCVSPSSPSPVRGLLERCRACWEGRCSEWGEGGEENTWNSSCCAGARASFLEIGPCSGEACHFRAWAGPSGPVSFSLAEGGLRLSGRVSSRGLRAALLPP